MLENSDEWSAENYCHEDKIKDEENIEFRTVKQKKRKKKNSREKTENKWFLGNSFPTRVESPLRAGSGMSIEHKVMMKAISE